MDMAENILLAIGVGIEVLCCIGVMVMPNAYAKLHFLSPGSTLGIVFIAIAVIIQFPLSQSCAKAVLVTGAILISGPVLSHASAHAIKMRDDGRLDEDDGGS